MRDQTKKKLRTAGPDKNGACNTGKTGMDLVHAVKNMIREQYPSMSEQDTMKLAVLLAKSGINGQI